MGTYKYVGCGGDFDVVRPRRDFTCIITSCCLLSLLLLIPLLMWLLCPKTPDCNEGMIEFWPQAKKDYCCMTMGRGCITTTYAPSIAAASDTATSTTRPSGSFQLRGGRLGELGCGQEGVVLQEPSHLRWYPNSSTGAG